MKIDKDGKGQPFITVGNVRVTLVPADKRSSALNWAAGECKYYIRIQAYKDNPDISQSLHPGTEFPVTNHKEVCALLSAISHLVVEEMT